MLSIILKIIAIVLGLVAITKSVLEYRKRQESFTVMAVWVVIWVVIIGLALYPAVIDSTIEYFSGRRGTIGQIAGLGFVLVLFVVYRVYLKAHRLDQKITKLVRRIALYEANKK